MEFGTGKMWESELLGYKQQQQQYLGFDKKKVKKHYTHVITIMVPRINFKRVKK